MATAATMEMQLHITDVSGQKAAYVEEIPSDSTVAELVQDLLPQMHLSHNDSAGRPLVYQALLEREGRHLHGSEKLAEAVEVGDHLVLQPNIDAAGERQASPS